MAIHFNFNFEISDRAIIYHAMKMHNVLIYRCWAQHGVAIDVYAQKD